MTHRVREATGEDITEVVALREEVAAELKWIAALPGADPAVVAARYEANLGQPHRVLLIAEHAGQIDGVISAELAPYGVADIGMFVRVSKRGQGVGKALVAAAIRWATAAGAHKVSLECWPHNAAAIRLYEQLGFVEEGRKRRHYRRGDGDAAWDSLIMGRLLDPDIPGSPYGD